MMKKELCRNFLRGNCRYGDKCKFLHSTQQQQQLPRANPFGFGSQTSAPFQQTNTQKQNPFGFGTQTSAPFQQTNTQQQKPNPFGFGVQNSSPSTGPSNFGGKQPNIFKPFENKWTRSSSGASSTSSQQQAKQSQAVNHECTDPESCKRIIAEDFEHEKPLWKLTCYSHYKYLPSDITGDVSYEELRAVAYDEAKRGVNLQSIVERERTLLNAKLNEFQSLLHNPYSRRTNPAPFPGASSLVANTSIPPPTVQQSNPPSVSSFGQLGPSLNIGLATRPAAPPNNAFSFQNSIQPAQTPVAIGPTTTPFAPSTSNVFSQTGGSPFSVNSPSFKSNSSSSMFFPSLPASQQFTNFADTQPSMVLNGPSHAGDGQKPALKPLESVQNVFSGDAAIWAKEKWNPGEIPEEAPPDEFIR